LLPLFYQTTMMMMAEVTLTTRVIKINSFQEAILLPGGQMEVKQLRSCFSSKVSPRVGRQLVHWARSFAVC
jgi:hypothetical protein